MVDAMWKIILSAAVSVILFSTVVNLDSGNPFLLSMKRKIFRIEEMDNRKSTLAIEWRAQDEFNVYIDETFVLHSLEEYKTTESFILYPLTYSEKLRSEEGILKIALIGPETGFFTEALQRSKTFFSVIDVYTTDMQVTEFFKNDQFFSSHNEESLKKNNIRIMTCEDFDRMDFAEKRYDMIYVNQLDPYDQETARYYSSAYFEKLRDYLEEDGMIVVNGTSPFFTRQSAETIYANLKETYSWVKPYYITLNAQGEWAYFIASEKPHSRDQSYLLSKVRTNYLNNRVCDTMEYFPKDVALKPIRHPEGIDEQFLSGWKSLVGTEKIQ